MLLVNRTVSIDWLRLSSGRSGSSAILRRRRTYRLWWCYCISFSSVSCLLWCRRCTILDGLEVVNFPSPSWSRRRFQDFWEFGLGSFEICQGLYLLPQHLFDLILGLGFLISTFNSSFQYFIYQNLNLDLVSERFLLGSNRLSCLYLPP